MDKFLHIVCLDVPYPPDYGGVFDLFYKIRYLSEAGVKIYLHCFEYGRGEAKELNKYCDKVYYYPRKKALPFKLPYIVASRKNKLLVERLRADDYPVLLEGIHCTYYLYNGALAGRNVWVRMHNIESEYYKNLGFSTHNILKKAYFRTESNLLAKFEKALLPLAKFLAVSREDKRKLQDSGAERVEFLPVFLGNLKVKSVQGKGDYCLFHGNLSVSENEEAALFIIREIIQPLGLKLFIAGKKPSDNLKKVCSHYHVNLIADPDDQQLENLLMNAQVNILPSMNSTGIKIKLINSLLKGRFVVSNSRGVKGSGLEELCLVAERPEDFQKIVKDLMEKEFPPSEIDRRQTVLNNEFDPVKNTQKLISLLFN